MSSPFLARITAEGSARLKAAVDRIAAIVDRKEPDPLPQIAAVVEDLESGDGPLSKRPEQVAVTPQRD